MSFLLRLQTFLKEGRELPALPATLIELQGALASDDVAVSDLVEVVEHDPPLAARLLRAANSALYARDGGRIAALAPAIGRIGLRQLRSVALAGAVLPLFRARSTTLRPEAFWAHSAAVGAAARHLATLRPGPGAEPDECYTAGLLHDVGLLVLDQFFPDDYRLIAEQRCELELPWWQQEEDAFGLDHGEIGGLLLGRWGLPAGVVDAVSFHHRPDAAPEEHRRAALVVHAAELVAARHPLALPDEGLEHADLEGAFARLDLDADDPTLRDRLTDVMHAAAGMLV